ncbi:hypothetical protein Taro_018680 [Colocasia esculenta]|uniref:Uncharacterized protein n=1 Tax=Colocasia esculenta TaxID=4460 RepID=A0A843UUF1_COLES|nr:hypothetical protein [Colocasia esculenta]
MATSTCGATICSLSPTATGAPYSFSTITRRSKDEYPTPSYKKENPLDKVVTINVRVADVEAKGIEEEGRKEEADENKRKEEVKKRKEEEEAEKKRKQEEEEQKGGKEEGGGREEAEEAEKKRKEAEEAEKKRKEEEHKRKEVEEEQKRKREEEEEEKRKEEEEEKKRKEAEEAEKKRKRRHIFLSSLSRRVTAGTRKRRQPKIYTPEDYRSYKAPNVNVSTSEPIFLSSQESTDTLPMNKKEGRQDYVTREVEELRRYMKGKHIDLANWSLRYPDPHYKRKRLYRRNIRR